jgi:hypothetical protein
MDVVVMPALCCESTERLVIMNAQPLHAYSGSSRRERCYTVLPMILMEGSVDTYSPIDLTYDSGRHVAFTKLVCHEASTDGEPCCYCLFLPIQRSPGVGAASHRSAREDRLIKLRYSLCPEPIRSLS